MRLLDTQSYMDCVNKAKGRRKVKGAAPTMQSLKADRRALKRRNSKLELQNKNLRHMVSS